MAHTRFASTGGSKLKASYGVDAPYLLPVLAVLLLIDIANAAISRSLLPLAGAVFILLCGACGLYTSRKGKFVVWRELLDALRLKGDERVLDLGCGRGAVLLLAARHLNVGRAVGVDIWQVRDQSGNSPAATYRNALAERVAARVGILTADMTALPFPDDSFDLVVSNVAIHNVTGRGGREKAIAEAWRVLRPGGRLLIADLWGTRDYCRHLARLGAVGISRRSLGWRMWWSGPWLRTQLVTGTKADCRDP